jgi:hypothetical protein
VFKKIHVTEGNKALDVYVPDTNDRSEAKDLEDYAIGKTKEDFKTKEIFNRKKQIVSKEDARQQLKEAQAYAEHKKNSVNKRVFGGISLPGGD